MSGIATGQHLDDFLEILSQHGGSGFEQSVGNTIRTSFSRYTDDIQTDQLGNLIAHISGGGDPAKKGVRPRILLSAHMDEIALMVTEITEDGFLRVAETGGFDARTLVGQEVVVHATQRVLGIIGSKPPHLTTPEERKHAVSLEDLYIDVAMRASNVRDQIQIGDRVTIAREPLTLQQGRIAGKALDNRASIAILLECMAHLQGVVHHAEVDFVATVQEEFGMVGAQTAGYRLKPDIAIAVDVTFGALPGQAPHESFALGAGPVITMGPTIHRKVFQGLRETAVQQRIPFQVEVSQGSTGTEADVLQLVAQGLAVGIVGVPIRYMHTSVETVTYDDIVACGQLLAHYIASLDETVVEGLTCY